MTPTEMHSYFTTPPGARLCNPADRFGRPADTHTQRGYVLAASSSLTTGGSGRRLTTSRQRHCQDGWPTY